MEEKKKLLCSLISLVIILSMAVVLLSTVVEASPATEIWDWYDLDAIRDNLDGDYILMNDIDSTTAGYAELANPTANDGKGWEPIGGIEIIDPDPLEFELVDPFAGNFDGRGYEIRDLFIHRPDEAAVALFGSVAGGAIENAKLLDANVTGNFGVGILVGANLGSVSSSCSSGSVGGYYGVGGLTGGNFGNVSDSHSSATVIGVHDGSGGLVGFNAGNLSQCYAIGNVSCNDHVGGLVGMNGEDNYYGTVFDSYASGDVNGVSYVGGLVGDNYDGTVSDSYASCSVTGENDVGGLVGRNEGDVSYCFASGSVNGDSHVGGLVGWNGNDGNVTTCYSTGNVAGGVYSSAFLGGLVGANLGTVGSSYSVGSVNGGADVGGLVGDNYYGTVTNCYSTGNVTGWAQVGGLAGFNRGTVDNSYSIGNVTGDGQVGGLIGVHCEGAVGNSYSVGSVIGNVDVGGLVGLNYEGTVTASFWDTQTSGRSTSAGGTGKTTAEMKDITTFSGALWDIVAVANPDTRNPSYTWNIVDDVTYPFLSWMSNNPPNPPSNPSPANHATNVSINVDVSWTGGDPDAGDTLTYDVYFGNSSPPLFKETIGPYGATQSSITYDPGTLIEGTIYYWQIVARDNHGITREGPVWHFTAGASSQDEPSPAVGFASLIAEGKLVIAYNFDPFTTVPTAVNGWTWYDPTLPPAQNNLAKLQTNTAYWVKVTEECWLTYGTESYHLAAGWNNPVWLGC
jgi:hypothetical protein